MSTRSISKTRFVPEFLPWDEWNAIAKRLDAISSVFYMMWKLGRPRICIENNPTLCVVFDHVGECIDFKINPDFWADKTDEQKAFLIAHECMHVILNHGLRIANIMVSPERVEIANFAMDIVVNEYLAEHAFQRKDLGDFSEKLCWIDTCFKKEYVEAATSGGLTSYTLKEPSIKKKQSFEYYYNLLLKQAELSEKEGDSDESQKDGDGKGNSAGKPMVVDDHSGLWDKTVDWQNLDQFFNEVANGCSPEDLKKFTDSVKDIIEKPDSEGGAGRGTCPGGGFLIVKVDKVKKKAKWETVIKKWADKFIKEADKDHEQWARLHRRFQLLDGEMFIPSEIEIEELDEEKKKIEVWFFQDTSGSCAHLAKRFFTAAKTLSPKRFNVRLFCFDTQVYETSLDSGKLYGFGGTSFTCIENEIQRIIKKENKKYPTVFVVTDGYGDLVTPQFPKKWYWFLSCDFKAYIPAESHKFNLAEFE